MENLYTGERARLNEAIFRNINATEYFSGILATFRNFGRGPKFIYNRKQMMEDLFDWIERTLAHPDNVYELDAALVEFNRRFKDKRIDDMIRRKFQKQFRDMDPVA